MAIASELVAQIREMLADYDWRSIAGAGRVAKAWLTAATTATNYLRDACEPAQRSRNWAPNASRRGTAPRPGSSPARGHSRRAAQTLAELHDEIAFYEEVRVWMAKFDAAERQSRDEPIPEEIQRLLGGLVASATDAGDVVDIYDAAGMPRLVAR